MLIVRHRPSDRRYIVTQTKAIEPIVLARSIGLGDYSVEAVTFTAVVDENFQWHTSVATRCQVYGTECLETIQRHVTPVIIVRFLM